MKKAHPARKLFVAAILLGLVLWLVFSLGGDPDDTWRSERARERDSRSPGAIVIGVVDSVKGSNGFLDGVRMAVDEINREGGVLGRKIVPIIYDDRGEVDRERRIAEKLTDNEEVVAVLGGRSAGPASIVYEKAGVVFLTPGSEDATPTLYGHRFIFSSFPAEEDIGRQSAEFVHARGYRRTAVFFERGAPGKRLANHFHSRANELGIEIAAVHSFFTGQGDSFRMLDALKKEADFDAVFITGGAPAGAELIRNLRRLGIEAPILGGVGLDSPDLPRLAGDAAEGMMVATVFHPLGGDDGSGKTRAFVERFEERCGRPVDIWAAQGHDAVFILASAMENCGSTAPLDVSNALRFLHRWHGVAGVGSFTPRGRITGRTLYFKTVRNGVFEFEEK